MTTTTSSSSSFPEIQLIPKQETNVLEFLNQHPDYDGRQVTIGILDSGVDPGASSALSRMLDGVTPKLTSIVDCSGAGDVDVSKEVKAVWKTNGESNGGYWSVQGLSGRELQLSADWTFQAFPPSVVTNDNDDNNKQQSKDDGEKEVEEKEKGKNDKEEDEKSVVVRLGIKRGYDLYATPLSKRIKAERQTKLNVEIAKYEAQVRKELADWNEKHGSATTLDTELVRQRDDLQDRLELLSSKDWQADNDPGPVYDCVVFFDGQDYRAVIGDAADLRSCQPLTTFSVEHEYATLGVADQLNYGVNFYDDGKLLSIVVDSSPHGTHVAGICAAAEGPDRNGVAPGASLVSLKIGDARMSGMETGGCLTRALIEAIRHKCDVINMSYGEASAVPNSGRFIELSEELVWKHHIEFVSSAGNSGPALTTAGTPGATPSCCLGVAAYVSPKMTQVLYSMPVDETEFPGSTFTWSSVGPAYDGYNAVDITAPGGAIAPVSSWCLQKTRLMNGTSMSSPHATGCVALLMSACKAEGINISPARIRRAIQNSAKVLPGLSPVEQGSGMIQVDKAWEYLKQNKDIEFEDVAYSVSVENLHGNPRGIYLRQPAETAVENSYTIGVEPLWRREENVSEAQQKARLAFETHFELESTCDWVSCPGVFAVMSGGRSFKISVDPSKLQPGLHTASVIGKDAMHPERGPIFNVPITVAKPMQEKTQIDLGRLSFPPTAVKRYFVVPPLGSTWMDIVVKDLRDSADADGAAKIFGIHAVQLLPHAAFREFEKQENFFLRPAQTVVVSLAVEEGITTEVAVSRYWSTLGDTDISVEMTFRGLRPSPNFLMMSSSGSGSLIRVTSDLASESMMPKASLNKWSTPVRPKAGAIVEPLGARDVFPSPDKKIHELVLTYEFTQDEKGSITPRVPALQGVLYESAFESQLILIFDSDKKLLGTCDAWPSSVSVPKGKIVARLQIRHDQPSKLEKLQDLTMWIERSVDSIPLSAYPTKEALVLGQNTVKKMVLRKGKSASVFFEEPSASKLPSSAKAGDVLEGSFTLGAGDDTVLGAGKRPGGFPIRYVVGPKAEKAPSDPETPEPEDTRTVEEKIEEAVRDLKVSQLGKLTQKEKDEGKFEEVYATLRKAYPDHLPLLMANLKYLDSHAKRTEKLQDVVEAANSVIDKISQDELALHFGKKSDSDIPEKVKERKEMKEKKSMLTEALGRLALAYSAMPQEEGSEKFAETLKRLKEWIDIDSSSNEKYAQLVMERDERAGRLGSVLKVVNKLLSKEIKEKDYLLPISKSSLYEKRLGLLEKLGYDSLVEFDKMSRVVACPPYYARF